MTEIWVAVLASGAVFSFFQFLISLFFSRKDKSKDIEKKIDDLSEKTDANQAILARTHILRFSDELKNGIEHSAEYFRQQLDDCDTYDKYCETHPDSMFNKYSKVGIKTEDGRKSINDREYKVFVDEKVTYVEENLSDERLKEILEKEFLIKL